MVWQQPHESKPWQTSTLTPIFIKKKDYIIKNCDNEKLLGVTVDANLNSNCHIENILKKACKKVHVLARITPYMSIPKRKLLMNSFFTSQFNYCPLTWMCHSRTMNNKINHFAWKVPLHCTQWQDIIFWKIVRERWICQHTY